jgi:uncharacterized membrane protein
VIATLVTVPAIGGTNVIEVLWVIFSLIGAFAIAPNLWFAIRGIGILALTPHDEVFPVKEEIVKRIRHELGREVIQMLLLVVGVIAVATPSAVKPERVTISGLFVTLIFLGVSAINVLQSVLDRRTSNRVRASFLQRNGHGDKETP